MKCNLFSPLNSHLLSPLHLTLNCPFSWPLYMFVFTVCVIRSLRCDCGVCLCVFPCSLQPHGGWRVEPVSAGGQHRYRGVSDRPGHAEHLHHGLQGNTHTHTHAHAHAHKHTQAGTHRQDHTHALTLTHTQTKQHTCTWSLFTLTHHHMICYVHIMDHIILPYFYYVYIIDLIKYLA